MVEPELRFIGPEYDGAEYQLSRFAGDYERGTFASKFGRMLTHEARRLYGHDSVMTITNIEMAPMVIDDDRFFAVRAIHKTPAGSLWSVLEGDFDIAIDDANAYLHHRAEGGWSYHLTTVETLALDSLVRFAAANDEARSPLKRELT